MTKEEYMQHLKEALQGYDRSFAEEILESYEEHFADGIKNGRTEEEICDELWYVYVEDSIRRKRLKYARGYEDCKVDQIFEAQLPKDLFMRHCDRVIDNSGQFEETKIQLNKIVEDL